MNLPISIIIPIYNVEKYLIECLESVRRQTFTDFEVIMVNDGSTDASAVIADNYCQRDERFKLLHQENQGVSVARNFGISQAKGDYIFFLDSDDKIVENSLDVMYRLAQAKDADIVMSSHIHFNNQGDIIHKPAGDVEMLIYSSVEAVERIESPKLWDPFVTAWAKLIKKEIIAKYLFPVGKYYEDLAVTYKWYLEANKICYINIGLYYYRLHDSSIMSTEYTNLPKRLGDYISHYQEKIDCMAEYDVYLPATLALHLSKLYQSRTEYQDFEEDSREVWKEEYQRYFSFQDFSYHAFTLTYSADLEHVEDLAQALPDLCIHIAAYTSVAPNLIDLAERLENIFIHPLAHNDLIEDLLNQADFYLDINYYDEVDDIVSRAIQKGLPVLAFESTAHRPDLVDEEQIFATDEVNAMVAKIKSLLKEKNSQPE
ncbi:MULTISPECIES: glycosyltransferase family 2 protein [Aerococcus]|uniref:glycosyltransferase family 2 protein n=1 Tax=Aerococcus urinae (strain CCUG 59500 / ACS-120-V-Col10a) TaxID=2976812 RepID=UPI00227BD05A|nr:glycosyltransferase [Aerococcus sp. Group 1]MCY3031105.1 glycosyltransferase [Aerococcus sp. Group 1]MCY3054259.1 glycosyltransferase [Aerococcus sp. Group 1]MCY3055989.1 glycosyltransferase [Aerococcus sp. Group 1]MCY3061865.1 glycosyltransferase [Aerococcus sp. Group 1]